MRIKLAAAVALGPLLIASGASAETVINNERTTPISTATANNGAPDSIRIANSGRIRINTGVAVTVNSDHGFDNDGGQITMEDAADGATAVLVEGGVTTTITNGGLITITDGAEGVDEDGDGDLDGPTAVGGGRYAIRLAGPGDVTGDIINERAGSIRVEGNDSYGIAVETGLVGRLQNFGSINILGDRSYAVRTTAPVTGDVRIGGSITVRGEDSVGASFEDVVDGRLIIDGAFTVTGFRYTGRLTDREIENLDEDDLLIGGPAVRVAADVTGGVLFDRAHVDSDPDDDEDDDDGDGIIDTQETTAAIVAFGPSPAVEIGSTSNTVTLGVVGTDDEAYGFINRGTIGAYGTFEGYSATAVRVGVEGGLGVTIDGGFLNDGQITAEAAENVSTGVHFGAGVSTDRFVNSGVITAQIAAEGDFEARAVHFDAGANVPLFENRGGVVRAVVFGETGDAVAIRDESGSLDSLTNTGVIEAMILRTNRENEITGRAIAIDLRANATGATIVQYGVDDGDDGDDGVDDPDADGDGVDDADEPAIVGDILFGAGDDSLLVQNGRITGGLYFGDGADALSITGGAVVRGVIDDTDGLLQIDVTNGVLEARQATPTTISGLTVGADGDLLVTIDPEAGNTGGFIVNGAADIAAGAGLGVRFTSLLQDPTRFTIVQATTLTAGEIDQTRLQQNSPYLFVVEAGADEAAGQVYVDARRRTATEFSFISSEASAYDAVYQALGTDAEMRDVFLAQTDRDGFMQLYEQLLPDHSGGPLLSLASGVDAVTRAMAGRGYPARAGETSAWLQEINFYADKDKDQAYGFRSEGFGVAGGVERGSSAGAFGLSVAFTSSDLEDPEAEAEENLTARLLEIGVYWRAQGVNWNVWARAAGGYASFDSVRQFIAPGVNRRSESDWSGYTLAAAAGASYDHRIGRYSIRPEFITEYFYLSEEAHTESGGGDGFDLAIDERDGHMLSSIAAVTFGAGFGENGWLRPELRLGWRQNWSFDGGTTVARFANGGAPFALTSDSIEGGGPIVGFRLNLGNELGFLAIEADAEKIEDYVRYALLLRATFRF